MKETLRFYFHNGKHELQITCKGEADEEWDDLKEKMLNTATFLNHLQVEEVAAELLKDEFIIEVEFDLLNGYTQVFTKE